MVNGTMHHVQRISLGRIEQQKGTKAWTRTIKVLCGFGVGNDCFAAGTGPYKPACKEWIEYTLFAETREGLLTQEEIAEEESKDAMAEELMKQYPDPIPASAEPHTASDAQGHCIMCGSICQYRSAHQEK